MGSAVNTELKLDILRKQNGVRGRFLVQNSRFISEKDKKNIGEIWEKMGPYATEDEIIAYGEYLSDLMLIEQLQQQANFALQMEEHTEALRRLASRMDDY